MERPGGSTLEEKVGALGAKHKHRRQEIDDKRSRAEESDDAFFKRKRLSKMISDCLSGSLRVR